VAPAGPGASLGTGAPVGTGRRPKRTLPVRLPRLPGGRFVPGFRGNFGPWRARQSLSRSSSVRATSGGARSSKSSAKKDGSVAEAHRPKGPLGGSVDKTRASFAAARCERRQSPSSPDW
jgi:hypothetical protein